MSFSIIIIIIIISDTTLVPCPVESFNVLYFVDNFSTVSVCFVVSFYRWKFVYIGGVLVLCIKFCCVSFVELFASSITSIVGFFVVDLTFCVIVWITAVVFRIPEL